MVLYPSQYGLLTWKVTLSTTSWGLTTVCFQEPSSPDIVSILRITDPHQWRAAMTMPVAPGNITNDRGGKLSAIVIAVSAARSSLLEHAALRGFPCMTLLFLKKAFDALEVPYVRGQKPRTEKAVCEALVRHILKMDGDDPAAAQIFEMRSGDDCVTEDVAVAEAGLWNLVIDEMGDEDLANAFHDAKAQAEKKAAARQRQAQPAGAGAAPIPLLPVAPVEREPVPLNPHRGLTRPEAKVLFPPGVRLYKDTTALRWQARARFLVPSVSKTFSQASHRSDDAALLYVLGVTWQRYSDRFGTPCPWILDVRLFE